MITITRTVDLNAPVAPEVLSAPLYEGEKNAHTFIIFATKNNAPCAMTGSVVAYLDRADNSTVRVEGEIIEGAASVTLPAECYLPGAFTLAIMLVGDDAQTAIYAASGRVKNTQEGDVIDGGSAIPTYDEIMVHLNKYLNANLSARVDQTPDGALITITDASGTTTAFVSNGKDGSGEGGGSGAGLPNVSQYDDGKLLTVSGGVWTAQAPANAVEADNTRPITSAAVFVTVGNINALLATI